MEGIKYSQENKIEKPPKRILEIGSGFRSIIETLKRGNQDFDFSVISDINPKIMQKMENEDGGIEGVQRMALAAYQLPFKDGSFDYILAMNFFGNSGMIVGKYHEHKLTSPIHGIEPEEGEKKLKLLFAELARVLSAGGEVSILETYTPQVARQLFTEYKDTYKDVFDLSEKSELLTPVGSTNAVIEHFSKLGEIYALKKK